MELVEVAVPLKTWSSPLEAMEETLRVEHWINQAIIELYHQAEDQRDGSLQHFLATHYLTAQVEGNKEIADLVTRLRRVGGGLGQRVIDKELLKEEHSRQNRIESSIEL